MRVHRLFAFCVASAGAFVALPALADPPATAQVVQLGLGFRYGFNMGDDPNPWGTGLGLSAGYTLPSAVYFGGNFDYFFGEKKTIGDAEVKARIWQIMAEGGYDIGLGDSVVVRPKAGLGMASLHGELCALGACASDSKSYVALAPGVSFLLLTKFSLVLDARYAVVFADEENPRGLLFTAGVGF